MKIDWLESSQHNGLVVLLCEHYNHYNPSRAADPVLLKRHLTECLLADSASTRLLVASNNQGDVLGFAAIALFYSLSDPRPDHSHQCVVKELYVGDAYRYSGVGSKLISRAAEWALEQGCASMDWDVRSSDIRGRRFYEGMGARILEDSVSYRVSQDIMQTLATL